LSIKKSLNNNSINLKALDAVFEEETTKRPSSPKERYDYLLKINPKLDNLKDKFDLDIE